MRVTIFGGGGLLGQDLQKEFTARGWEFDSPTKERANVLDLDSLTAVLNAFRPTWVINCAAYVAVDDAEQEIEAAFALNEHGARSVAQACDAVGSRLIHISTDYVFDGRKTEPYAETEATNPLGVYAKSKLAGENAVLSVLRGAIIARTAWLYGSGRENFPLKILRAAMEGKALRLVADRIGSPTYTVDLATGIANMMDQDMSGGIYNVVNEGEASWYDLCKEMIEYAGIDVSVDKAMNSDYPTPAERPMYSVLSSDKLLSAGVPGLPHWRDAVRRFVDELRRLRVIPT